MPSVRSCSVSSHENDRLLTHSCLSKWKKLNSVVFLLSGKTEYQTTKANKARRSASFERRPSRRYSRRTMHNRGELGLSSAQRILRSSHLQCKKRSCFCLFVIASEFFPFPFLFFFSLQDHLIPTSKCIFIYIQRNRIKTHFPLFISEHTVTVVFLE